MARKLVEVMTKPVSANMGLAGLGFAYCEQPLDYRFHADTIGEDVHFWRDHPELQIHWIPDPHLGHRKPQILFT